MSKNRFDFVIIGGGILGISIGIEIIKILPKAKVAIIEKEDILGSHASGRNSGVLHAGFYYSPELLKAKFCYEGNRLMREFVSRNRLQINSVGKVVLAKSQEEFDRLTKLYERGIANGIRLELLDQKELEHIEPLARSKFPFIWSPDTAVVDQNEIMKILQIEFLKLGGVIVSSSMVELTVTKGNILIKNQNIQADFIINSAGAYALKIAQSIGAGTAFKSLPVLGTYYSVESKHLDLKTLVYPVPHSTNPFLGVHLTPSINKLIKLGPTAIPVLGNEQYNIFNFGSSLSNLRTFSTILEFGFRQRKIAFEIFKQELPYLFVSNMITEMAKLVPEVRNIKSWNKSKPGIRAQLLKSDSLEFVDDFIIEEKYNSIHLLNIVSPGFTSAIPLATLAAKKAVSASSL